MSSEAAPLPFDISAPTLPPGWCWTTVGEIGKVRLGRQRSPKNRSRQYPTKYIRAANITWQGLDLSDVLDMEFTPAEREVYTLQAGDVLLSEASGSADEVGKPVIWNGEIEGCCFQNTVIRFRPKEIPPGYPLVVFSHFARNGVFAQTSKGVGIHHLSADRFAQLPFPLPPLKEQRRIVDKVDELFSELDAGAAALQRARANLKRYRAAVLKEAAEGALTEEWRAAHPDTEPASKLLERILGERRGKCEAARSCNDLPQLPLGWCWATIEQLESSLPRSIQSGPFGSNLLHSEFQDSGMLAIGIDNVLDGKFSMGSENRISPEKFEQLQKYRARPLDVVITVMATVGRCCVIPADIEPAIITKHVYRITAEQRLVDPHYLSLCLSGAPAVRKQIFGEVRGQTRPGINGRILKGVAIPIPPLAEQIAIIDRVAQQLSDIAVTENYLVASLKRATRLRQSILREAFAGRLVPQDPSEEPAGALLERIRQERANATIPPPAQSNGRGRRPPRARRRGE